MDIEIRTILKIRTPKIMYWNFFKFLGNLYEVLEVIVLTQLTNNMLVKAKTTEKAIKITILNAEDALTPLNE